MKILKRTKKSWEPFRSCLINSTTNPAQLGWKWAGLAVQVTSKWLPRFFSYFQNIFLNDFIKNPQTRNARTFLPLNISAVGSVGQYDQENQIETSQTWLLNVYCAAMVGNAFVLALRCAKQCQCLFRQSDLAKFAFVPNEPKMQ